MYFQRRISNEFEPSSMRRKSNKSRDEATCHNRIVCLKGRDLFLNRQLPLISSIFEFQQPMLLSLFLLCFLVREFIKIVSHFQPLWYSNNQQDELKLAEQGNFRVPLLLY
jgi:hypothetical protein